MDLELLLRMLKRARRESMDYLHPLEEAIAMIEEELKN
jgi:hypothetical protein